jgi:hypothetical protein
VIRRSVESTDEIRPLVAKYGWRRVWRVGIDVLGYPPTWEPSLIEVLNLKSELEK